VSNLVVTLQMEKENQSIFVFLFPDYFSPVALFKVSHPTCIIHLKAELYSCAAFV